MCKKDNHQVDLPDCIAFCRRAFPKWCYLERTCSESTVVGERTQDHRWLQRVRSICSFRLDESIFDLKTFSKLPNSAFNKLDFPAPTFPTTAISCPLPMLMLIFFRVHFVSSVSSHVDLKSTMLVASVESETSLNFPIRLDKVYHWSEFFQQPTCLTHQQWGTLSGAYLRRVPEISFILIKSISRFHTWTVWLTRLAIVFIGDRSWLNSVSETNAT